MFDCQSVFPLLTYRERTGGNKICIRMEGQNTYIGDSKTSEKLFQYDYSFWSALPDANFIDQATVFQNIGLPLLNRSLEGYNCCLFAYGQVTMSMNIRYKGYEHALSGYYGF